MAVTALFFIPLSVAAALGAFAGLAILTAGAQLLFLPVLRRAREAALERHREAGWADENRKAQLTAAVRAGMNPGCVTDGAAAAYESWHGTVHTFAFLSRRYADAVRAANAGKVVG
jgi:hypothetical protein